MWLDCLASNLSPEIKLAAWNKPSHGLGQTCGEKPKSNSVASGSPREDLKVYRNTSKEESIGHLATPLMPGMKRVNRQAALNEGLISHSLMPTWGDDSSIAGPAEGTGCQDGTETSTWGSGRDPPNALIPKYVRTRRPPAQYWAGGFLICW